MRNYIRKFKFIRNTILGFVKIHDSQCNGALGRLYMGPSDIVEVVVEGETVAKLTVGYDEKDKTFTLHVKTDSNASSWDTRHFQVHSIKGEVEDRQWEEKPFVDNRALGGIAIHRG